MAIRIKSERVHRLAKELAAITGESQVTAIERALEEQLAEIQRARSYKNDRLSEQTIGGPYSEQDRT